MAKGFYELSDLEWHRLMNDFADLVLKKHNVAGSVGSYSLYRALEDEWLEAKREINAERRRLDREWRELSTPK